MSNEIVDSAAAEASPLRLTNEVPAVPVARLRSRLRRRRGLPTTS